MATTKVHPYIGEARLLAKQILDAERNIASQSIRLSTRDRLFRKLSENQRHISQLQEKISVLRESAVWQGVHSHLQELDERIVILYGKIQNLAVENEVSDIAREARDLENSLKRGELQKAAAAVAELQVHIETFMRDHAPGREERRMIQVARATQQKASHFLAARQAPPQISCPPRRDEEIDAELVIELFETAECFYRKKLQDGLRRFHPLNQEAKERFFKHLVNLGIQNGDPAADTTKSAQALIAAAYDLADSHDGVPYLTESQLEELFLQSQI